MQPMSAETKAKVADTAKATARGPVATTTWGAIIWMIFVDQLHWLGDPHGRATIATYTIVGGVATVWTGVLRLLERRYPWFGTLLLSQGIAQYNPTAPTEPEQAPPPAVIVNNGPATTSTGVQATVVLAGATPPFTADPTVPPPGTVTALADPNSFDTSLTPIVTDPDDLLEGH